MASQATKILDARRRLRERAFFNLTVDQTDALVNAVQALEIDGVPSTAGVNFDADPAGWTARALDTLMPIYGRCHDAYPVHVLQWESLRTLLAALQTGAAPAVAAYREAMRALVAADPRGKDHPFNTLALTLGRDTVASRRLLGGGGALASLAPPSNPPALGVTVREVGGPTFGQWESGAGGGAGVDAVLKIAQMQRLRIEQLERQNAELRANYEAALRTGAAVPSALDDAVRQRVARALGDILGVSPRTEPSATTSTKSANTGSAKGLESSSDIGSSTSQTASTSPDAPASGQAERAERERDGKALDTALRDGRRTLRELKNADMDFVYQLAIYNGMLRGV